MNNVNVIFFEETYRVGETPAHGIRPYDVSAVRHISPERLAELSNEIYLDPVPACAGQAD